ITSARICVNKSVGMRDSLSVLIEGRIPCRSQRCKLGKPCPDINSVADELETDPPESAIIWISSSEHRKVWTWVISGPSSFALFSALTAPGFAPGTPIWIVLRNPNSRAKARSSTAVSHDEYSGPRSAIAMVSNWSSELKYCLRTRRASEGWRNSLLGFHQ